MILVLDSTYDCAIPREFIAAADVVVLDGKIVKNRPSSLYLLSENAILKVVGDEDASL